VVRVRTRTVHQNVHFVFKTFSWKSCHLWDNVEKFCIARQVTDDNIIWYMHFACWVTKDTDTHCEYVIPIAYPWQEWLCKHSWMLHLYEPCLSCYIKWFKLIPFAASFHMPLSGVQLRHTTVSPQWLRSPYHWAVCSVCWCPWGWLFWKPLS